MRHSVSREEVMKRKQHHTSAGPRWSQGRSDMQIEFQRWFGKGWRDVETLWRILLHRALRIPVRGRP